LVIFFEKKCIFYFWQPKNAYFCVK
jgi:hypothetical protein